MGIEIASELDWLLLEDIPTGRQLRDELLRWAEYPEDDEPFGIGARLFRCLTDWGEGLTELGNPVPSSSLYEGMAAGFDDVRDAIRARLRREHDEPEQAS